MKNIEFEDFIFENSNLTVVPVNINECIIKDIFIYNDIEIRYIYTNSLETLHTIPFKYGHSDSRIIGLSIPSKRLFLSYHSISYIEDYSKYDSLYRYLDNELKRYEDTLISYIADRIKKQPELLDNYSLSLSDDLIKKVDKNIIYDIPLYCYELGNLFSYKLNLGGFNMELVLEYITTDNKEEFLLNRVNDNFKHYIYQKIKFDLLKQRKKYLLSDINFSNKVRMFRALHDKKSVNVIYADNGKELTMKVPTKSFLIEHDFISKHYISLKDTLLFDKEFDSSHILICNIKEVAFRNKTIYQPSKEILEFNLQEDLTYKKR